MSEYMEYDWMAHMSMPNIKSTPATKKSESEIEIQNLRKLIQETALSGLEIPQHLPNNVLLKFLLARKFNLDETLQLISKYYCHRKEQASLFENFNIDADDIRDCLENSLPGVLPSKDRKGRTVLFICANNWDCKYSLLSVYRAIIFCLDHLIEDIHNQTNGFVFIVDWTEFTFRRTLNLKPSILRLMIEGFQDCFPARFKEIHFVNQPWYVETALTCIKPFLKEDMKDRIYSHGNNLSTLHEYVHRDILPTELGGEQPSFNPNVWLKSSNLLKI